MPFLVLDRLDKSFGSQAVLRQLSLEIEKGEGRLVDAEEVLKELRAS
jgi:hypothetical protein